MSPRRRATDDVWGLCGISLALFGLMLLLLDFAGVAMFFLCGGALLLYRAFTEP